MRIGISLAVFLALGSTATAQQSQPQPTQPRIIGVISGDQHYCLTDRAMGTMNCNFATLDQCQQATTVGREGDCGVNPRLTTGVRPRE